MQGFHVSSPELPMWAEPDPPAEQSVSLGLAPALETLAKAPHPELCKQQQK